MKKLFMLFAVIALIAGLSTSVIAQTNSNAGAKIVQALVLTNSWPLHFGTMTIPTTAATVLVDAAGNRTLGSGTITLLPQAPTAQSSMFHVVGSIAATYAITLPADATVTITSGTDIMHIDGFVAKSASTSSTVGGTLDASGFDDFTVGATLKLIINQPAGVYAGTFPVTVTYN